MPYNEIIYHDIRQRGNYEKLLISLSKQATTLNKKNIIFGWGNANYLFYCSDEAKKARENLITNLKWKIIDRWFWWNKCPDTIPPLLSSEDKTIQATQGNELTLETVTANDNKDWIVNVTRTWEVDFNNPWTYEVKYMATDSAWNKSEITHTYVVNKKEEKTVKKISSGWYSGSIPTIRNDPNVTVEEPKKEEKVEVELNSAKEKVNEKTKENKQKLKEETKTTDESIWDTKVEPKDIFDFEPIGPIHLEKDKIENKNTNKQEDILQISKRIKVLPKTWTESLVFIFISMLLSFWILRKRKLK